MRRLVLLALALLAAGCASVEPSPRVTREDVVELARAGADAKWIIDRLRETRTVLALTASDFVELHAQGVPQEALDWMQRAQIEELRRRDAVFYGSPYGPCGVSPRAQLWHPATGWRFNPWPCW